jgi:hypothetical protein
MRGSYATDHGHVNGLKHSRICLDFKHVQTAISNPVAFHGASELRKASLAVSLACAYGPELSSPVTCTS